MVAIITVIRRWGTVRTLLTTFLFFGSPSIVIFRSLDFTFLPILFFSFAYPRKEFNKFIIEIDSGAERSVTVITCILYFNFADFSILSFNIKIKVFLLRKARKFCLIILRQHIKKSAVYFAFIIYVLNNFSDIWLQIDLLIILDFSHCPVKKYNV